MGVGKGISLAPASLGVQRRECRVWDNGIEGHQRTHPAPLRNSTGRTEDLATTATRQLLRTRCNGPSWGRTIGHLKGLGTLVLGKPQMFWALFPLHCLRGLVGLEVWDRGRGVSGCTVQGAGGRAHPMQSGLDICNTNQGLAGGQGLCYFAAICDFLRC